MKKLLCRSFLLALVATSLALVNMTSLAMASEPKTPAPHQEFKIQFLADPYMGSARDVR